MINVKKEPKKTYYACDVPNGMVCKKMDDLSIYIKCNPDVCVDNKSSFLQIIKTGDLYSCSFKRLDADTKMYLSGERVEFKNQ